MIHCVVERFGEGPVYRLCSEKGDQTLQVLRHNLLLPVNDLHLEPDEQIQHVPRRKQKQRYPQIKRDTAEQEFEHSDEEEEYSRCLRNIP